MLNKILIHAQAFQIAIHWQAVVAYTWMHRALVSFTKMKSSILSQLYTREHETKPDSLQIQFYPRVQYKLLIEEVLIWLVYKS